MEPGTASGGGRVDWWMVVVGLAGVGRLACSEALGVCLAGGEAWGFPRRWLGLGHVGRCRFILDGTLGEALSCCCRRPPFGAASISQRRSTGEEKRSPLRQALGKLTGGNNSGELGWIGYLGCVLGRIWGAFYI
jgi:hypothetical protein